jgi:hypothetical protein
MGDGLPMQHRVCQHGRWATHAAHCVFIQAALQQHAPRRWQQRCSIRAPVMLVQPSPGGSRLLRCAGLKQRQLRELHAEVHLPRCERRLQGLQLGPAGGKGSAVLRAQASSAGQECRPGVQARSAGQQCRPAVQARSAGSYKQSLGGALAAQVCNLACGSCQWKDIHACLWTMPVACGGRRHCSWRLHLGKNVYQQPASAQPTCESFRYKCRCHQPPSPSHLSASLRQAAPLRSSCSL